MRLKNKVAIITGAGNGMGKAAAKMFCKEGAKVIIADYQGVYNRAVGKETEKELLDAGYEALYIETDVSDEEAVKAMVEKTVQTYGRIDILYNNASHGYSSPFQMADVVQTSLESWNKVVAVNMNGVYLCCKYVLPHMIKQKEGSIVNCSSINGLVAMPGADAYTAAKGGVIALTRILAMDHATSQIRVNCICPGGTLTPMIEKALQDPDILAGASAQVPLGRLGKPEEIAAAALFLASDEASYITGVILPVDGGWTAR